MGKADATSAKSLEEIIASIRKSLSGDGAGSRGAAARQARAEPELPMPAASPLAGDGVLTDRLAGALNGAAAAAPLDEDIADILEMKKPASPGARAVSDMNEPGRDELSPPPRGAGSILGGPIADRMSEAPERGPATDADDAIKLSRPADLRASLPPLFGADADQVAPLRAPDEAEAADGVGAVRADGVQGARQPADEPGKPATRDAIFAKAQPLAPPLDGDLGKADGSMGAEPLQPTVTAAPAPAPAPVAAEAPDNERADAQPAGVSSTPSPNGEVKADADWTTAASAAPAAVQPARKLEHVIGELLEPVIRHWLDTNLPRMVEEVVREEVARAIAAERASKSGT